jgi:hypothetical protein
MSETSAVTLSAARHLVAAQVAHLAAGLGVPAMVIKGPTLAAHGLRDPRESADVDALASPDRVAVLQDALEQAGWTPMPDTTAHIIEQHSVTLTHEFWPLELDLHWYFPGFLADWQVSFDVLWERRETIDIAHQAVPMPDRAGAALIAALHYERAPETYAYALQHLVDRTRAAFGPDDLADLAAVAAATGCADVLAGYLDAVGAPATGRGESDPQRLTDWNLNRSAGRLTGAAWLDALRKAPWGRRPRLLWSALMSTEDDLRFRYPDVPAGWPGLWIARWRRLMSATSAAPRTIRALSRPR